MPWDKVYMHTNRVNGRKLASAPERLFEWGRWRPFSFISKLQAPAVQRLLGTDVDRRGPRLWGVSDCWKVDWMELVDVGVWQCARAVSGTEAETNGVESRLRLYRLIYGVLSGCTQTGTSGARQSFLSRCLHHYVKKMDVLSVSMRWQHTGVGPSMCDV